MKILVISNFYPPHYIGGYELGCRDIVEELKKRGHSITVLTSTYGINEPQIQKDVFRCLPTDFGWNGNVSIKEWRTRMMKWEWTGRQRAQRTLASVQPDLIYVWNLSHIPASIVLTAHKLGYPICFYISDSWMCEWQKKDPWIGWQRMVPMSRSRAIVRSTINKLLGCPKIADHDVKFKHLQFTSRFIKEYADRVNGGESEGKVIEWGVRTDLFLPQGKRQEIKRLLYVGQMNPDKGVHTAVEAFQRLATRYPEHGFRLSIAGGVIGSEYHAKLKQTIESAGLQDHVCFLGKVPREELPDIYKNHDVLIFPSTWDEPFSIALLEGLSSGLAVVGTLTGGSREVLENGCNALTFTAGDSEACAGAIEHLMKDSGLASRIRINGRRTVENRFRLEDMAAKVENELEEALKDSANG